MINLLALKSVADTPDFLNHTAVSNKNIEVNLRSIYYSRHA
jgi:hypothetical protein